MNRWRPWLIVALLAACPAFGALGETESEIARRFGRPDPLLQHGLAKNVTIWSIETEQSERLAYTVTFNAKGRSMAEGLKPVRRAILSDAHALQFIDSQLALHPDGSSTRRPKPGEKYTFAGQEFVCGTNEAVWVDEPRDFLIVWTKGSKGHVLAVRTEMLRGTP